VPGAGTGREREEVKGPAEHRLTYRGAEVADEGRSATEVEYGGRSSISGCGNSVSKVPEMISLKN
jgi:hypothetical protein